MSGVLSYFGSLVNLSSTHMQDAANAIIDADTHATVDAPSSDATPHPAGISRNWSGLYVWLQYCQWYKVHRLYLTK